MDGVVAAVVLGVVLGVVVVVVLVVAGSTQKACRLSDLDSLMTGLASSTEDWAGLVFISSSGQQHPCGRPDRTLSKALHLTFHPLHLLTNSHNHIHIHTRTHP